MEFKNRKINTKEIAKAILCIAVGTVSGLIVYAIFLYFNIAIFGWNLGLIFAPLAAGYVETVLAVRLIGENIGAISAFILFIDTTFYSFILKNPTLGWNLITAGSIFVILQAAFPTLINHIILVVLGGVISNVINRFKKYIFKLKNIIKHQKVFRWEGGDVEINAEVVPIFDETKSNKKLNSLGFYFLTSSDMKDRKHKIMGMYQSEVIIEKDTHIIQTEPEKIEKQKLVNIKQGKDECLIKLAEKIKDAGGNGILDLSMNYSVIGLGGDNIQITAMGMAIKIIN